MSLTTNISILLVTLKVISSSYLTAESNYGKSVSERNNVVNKGVWIGHPKDKGLEQSNTGNFIFRANSLDVDNLLQNNFDAFGENGMQDAGDIFGYPERSKRSAELEREKLLGKDLTDCKGDKECILKTIDKSDVKSELISKLKPTSVFNDYPYEVAILLGDNRLDVANKIRKAKESGDQELVIPLNKNKDTSKLNIDALDGNDLDADKPKNININNSLTTPKRSMSNEYESKVIKKIEITENLNDDDERENMTSKFDRGILDKEEKVWHQNPDTSYMVKQTHPKSKLINERGLIKVLSMLTKTFKKIMRQHNDIRKIHSKLHNINEEVNKNIIDMSKKYQDIEEKYISIVSINDKIKEFQTNMQLKEEYFRARDRDMANNMAEFENQQKKFLTQQRQFYNIQKLMLAQNEKINLKQNLIAKTQSEISHRQNNFARILKKAKQIYIGSKHTTQRPTLRPVNETEEISKITHTTTSLPYTTDSIKINLFSIPALNKLVNQDIQILKEKDEQPVDDLVYKYYFNNTFIDNLMKSKVLSSFVTTAENTEITRNTKNKRHRNVLKTTILLPTNNFNMSDNVGKLTRERRWIRHRHQSKAKLKKTNKKQVENKFNDGKPLQPKDDNLVTKLYAKDKDNPFMIMAKSFCNEIGQNSNDQMLKWCVEKSLRRLQFLDSKMSFFTPPPETVSEVDAILKLSPGLDEQKTTLIRTEATQSPEKAIASSITPEPIISTPLTVAPVFVSESTQANLVFFPDNEELESNLKEFDVKPDTEGNFYYDGSLHASDLGIGDASDGLSDLMPGLDSNSRVDVNPMTFTLQAKRRAAVKRINAQLMKKLHG